ncbi:MAG: stomatin-like protein [Desulfocurvibacter africanus]
MEGLIVAIVLAVLALVILVKTAVIVPQMNRYVVERLGKYKTSMDAGFHILVPFIDKVGYKFSLKETVIDTPKQSCVTRDNVVVDIDGVIYIQVMDAKQAAYGIDNYLIAATQLAQTTLRSVIGTYELDKTFEEREEINRKVVDAVDQAASSWGIKVLRYEIKDITMPQPILESMQKQMQAEREKRAAVLKSEGEREAAINQSLGEKERAINESLGYRERLKNEAAGEAAQIEAVATATAEGIRSVALALQENGGHGAASLRLAEQYIEQFGKLAKETNTMILPINLADIGGTVAGLTKVLDEVRNKGSFKLS